MTAPYSQFPSVHFDIDFERHHFFNHPRVLFEPFDDDVDIMHTLRKTTSMKATLTWDHGAWIWHFHEGMGVAQDNGLAQHLYRLYLKRSIAVLSHNSDDILSHLSVGAQLNDVTVELAQFSTAIFTKTKIGYDHTGYELRIVLQTKKPENVSAILNALPQCGLLPAGINLKPHYIRSNGDLIQIRVPQVTMAMDHLDTLLKADHRKSDEYTPTKTLNLSLEQCIDFDRCEELVGDKPKTALFTLEAHQLNNLAQRCIEQDSVNVLMHIADALKQHHQTLLDAHLLTAAQQLGRRRAVEFILQFYHAHSHVHFHQDTLQFYAHHHVYRLTPAKGQLCKQSVVRHIENDDQWTQVCTHDPDYHSLEMLMNPSLFSGAKTMLAGIYDAYKQAEIPRTSTYRVNSTFSSDLGLKISETATRKTFKTGEKRQTLSAIELFQTMAFLEQNGPFDKITLAFPLQALEFSLITQALLGQMTLQKLSLHSGRLSSNSIEKLLVLFAQFPDLTVTYKPWSDDKPEITWRIKADSLLDVPISITPKSKCTPDDNIMAFKQNITERNRAQDQFLIRLFKASPKRTESQLEDQPGQPRLENNLS